MTAAMLQRAIDGGKEPGAANRRRLVAGDEGVERSSLDEALEDALVDQTQIDVLAQRVERVDPAALLADGEHRQHGALPHVLDGAEAKSYAVGDD